MESYRDCTQEELVAFETGLQKFCESISKFRAIRILSSGETRGKSLSWAKRQVRRAGIEETS
jgi:hypothetical protein